MEIDFTNHWRETIPGAHIGLLLIAGVDNTHQVPSLERHKKELEAELRQRYAGLSRAELLALDTFACYKTYYKKYMR